MVSRLQDKKILMYSHDTFGLGHLRRSRAIAHALVSRFKGLSILIISGSSIAGAFDFKARVDFVKIPSVIKLYNGEYTSLSGHINLDETLNLREETILNTAKTFQPDMFIVDKEPVGLKGEVEKTLQYLRTQDCRLVLGLRDVLDSPRLLKKEWEKADLINKANRYFDDIWVYGPDNFWNPLQGLNISPSLKDRIRYMGFIKRENDGGETISLTQLPNDFILVTTGGGGDGIDVVESILSAYEHNQKNGNTKKLSNAVIILGPFIPVEARNTIVERAQSLPQIYLLDFDNKIEALIERCDGMLCMGGYNTFCEIISFDKPAIVIPRDYPREEQLIRSKRAHEIGLLKMLHLYEARKPENFN